MYILVFGIFTADTEADYWRHVGQSVLEQHLAKEYISGRAKNVILFLGDGMSVPTITAARIFSGQLKGQSGEESQLSFEKFPFTGFAKVCSFTHSCIHVM